DRGAAVPASTEPNANAPAIRYEDYRVIRRNGSVVAFEPGKISIAMTKAFLAVSGGQGAASARIRNLVEELTGNVVAALVRGKPGGATFHIEDIQDHVELALMRSGEHEVARAYVLYRERRAQERAAAREKQAAAGEPTSPVLRVVDNGVAAPLDERTLAQLIDGACEGLGDHVDAS